jgi:membrane fusion protein (multidrug efflux system)
MRAKAIARLATPFLVLLALAACGKDKPAQTQAMTPEVVVHTMVAQPVTLTTELPGRTSAFLISEVRPQVGGIIQKRLFKEGGEVKQGETLYQIDPATYQAAHENAKAALAKAEANALPARLKAERYANLAKVRAVSKQDNDDAQAAYKQAEAEVVATKAALDTARINLGYTRVTAPISGRIGKSSVTPGALVTASQATALAVIQQTDPIYVDVTQSSTEVLRLKREMDSGKLKRASTGGAKVNLLLSDGRPYSQEGVLQFADITVEQSTGEVTLRAVFPNPRHDLLPGLYVRAVLTEGVNESALLVPQPAIIRDAKGNAMVMVVGPDDAVQPRPVQLSRVVGTSWLVDSGLAAGERVIVEGLQRVRPGVKVKATEAGDGQANATAPAPAAAPAANAAAKPAEQPAAKPEANAAAKPAEQPAAKPEAKPEPKPEPKAEPKADKKAEPKAPAAPPAEKKSDKPAEAKAEKKPEVKVVKQAAQPEAESAKAEKKAAAKAAKPEAKADAKAVKKPEAKPEAKSEAAKSDTAQSDKPVKYSRPSKGEGAAYSPPKDQWPVSRIDGASAPAASEAK